MSPTSGLIGCGRTIGALTLSLPPVANHRLAPLVEAGDTSGVSYGAHTSIRPRGEGTLAVSYYLYKGWGVQLPRPVGEGRGEGTIPHPIPHQPVVSLRQRGNNNGNDTIHFPIASYTKRACKATHIMIYVLPYRLSYPPDPRTPRPISVRLRRNRLILGHKQLHDNPSEQIGYRAVAEDHEVAGFLALESEELGLCRLDMIQQAA